MNLQLVVEQKYGFVLLRKLLRRCEDIAAIQDAASVPQWYYFRRSHPVKIGVYLEGDFQPGYQPNPVEDALNKPELFSESIARHTNDLLCLQLESGWQEFVRFENQWVQKPAHEYTAWRHYLVAKGIVAA